MTAIHRIKRQIIELELPHEGYNSLQRKEYARTVSTLFSATLEAEYSRLQLTQPLRITHLELDLGELQPFYFEAHHKKELQKRIDQAVEQQLLPLLVEKEAQALATANATTAAENNNTLAAAPKNMRRAEAVTHFLQTGNFPWWARKTAMALLYDTLPFSFDALHHFLKRHTYSLPRLLHHYTDAQLLAWCATGKIDHVGLDLVEDLLSKLHQWKAPYQHRTAVWFALLIQHYDYSNRTLMLQTVALRLIHHTAFTASVYHAQLQANRTAAAQLWAKCFAQHTPSVHHKKGNNESKIDEKRLLNTPLGHWYALPYDLPSAETVQLKEVFDALPNTAAKEAFWLALEQLDKATTFATVAKATAQAVQQTLSQQERTLLLNNLNASAPREWQAALASNTPSNTVHETTPTQELLNAFKKAVQSTQPNATSAQHILSVLERLKAQRLTAPLLALVNDILPLFAHYKATLRRQQKGLTKELLATLQELMLSIDQQFDFGQLHPTDRSSWADIRKQLTATYQPKAIKEEPKTAAAKHHTQLQHLYQQWLEGVQSQEVWQQLQSTLLYFDEEEALQLLKALPVNNNHQEKTTLLAAIQLHYRKQNGNAAVKKEASEKAIATSTPQQTPLPQAATLLTLLRQWSKGIATTSESRHAITQLLEFVKAYTAKDTNAHWLKVKQEGMWALREMEKIQNNNAQQNKKQKTIDTPTTTEERIFISNAGLVLLWSFLPHLFTHLNMLEENQFKSETEQERAILLLHYIVTEQTEAIESDLLLNKLILGWPLEAPCAVAFTPTKEETDQVNSLLETIVGYNPMMNNETVSSLRGNFLLHDGVLALFPENYTLDVEKKPYDILLSKFPWTWDTVKTAYMNKPLMVTWNT